MLLKSCSRADIVVVVDSNTSVKRRRQSRAIGHLFAPKTEFARCVHCAGRRLLKRQYCWKPPLPPYLLFSVPRSVKAPEKTIAVSVADAYGAVRRVEYGLTVAVARGASAVKRSYVVGRHAVASTERDHDFFADLWVRLDDAARPALSTHAEWTARVAGDAEECVAVAMYTRRDYASAETVADLSLRRGSAPLSGSREICIPPFDCQTLTLTNINASPLDDTIRPTCRREKFVSAI
jgi:hypothetical protein